MKFPLTDQLIDEARRFDLRSACRDCFYFRPAASAGAHGWPDIGQSRWPLDAPDPITGDRPLHAEFCKEFETR